MHLFVGISGRNISKVIRTRNRPTIFLKENLYVSNLFFVCQLIKSTLTAIVQLKTLNCVKFDLVVDIVRESIKEDEEQAWASICQKNRQI